LKSRACQAAAFGTAKSFPGLTNSNWNPKTHFFDFQTRFLVSENDFPQGQNGVIRRSERNTARALHERGLFIVPAIILGWTNLECAGRAGAATALSGGRQIQQMRKICVRVKAVSRYACHRSPKPDGVAAARQSAAICAGIQIAAFSRKPRGGF